MNGNKKNVWILGGTGFIGKALIKQLSLSDEYLLHLLVHQNIPYKFLEPFSIFTGSLENFDLTWLENYPPDIVFHLARLGGSNAISRSLSSSKGAKANERLIRFLSGMNNPPIIVYVSGSLMYGPQGNGKVANELSELKPVSYARYYYRAEEPWIKAQSSEKLDVRFARPGWILGPDSWFRFFYRDHFLRTGKVPLYGDGNQLMSIIHLEDCASQIVKLAEKGQKNQNLNVFSGAPVSQKHFAEMLASHLNAEVELIPVTKLQKKYGRTVTKALTTSIPMTTNYPELCKSDSFRYPDAESMIKSVLSFFEHKQGVLSKSP
jgi:nucleoside-diphosphate-sugar epimerase